MNSAPWRRLGRSLIGMLLLAASADAAIHQPPAPVIGDVIRAELRLQRFVERLDRSIEQAHREASITPAPQTDDAAFLRRAYLDINGRIPRLAETYAFLKDTDPNKRAKLIDRLLAHPRSLEHLSISMRRQWLPEANDNPQALFAAVQVDTWLARRLQQGVAYDKMVRELLTAPLMNFQGGGRFQADQTFPQGFYQVLENRPENLGSAVSRIFLGIKLECAQCHDHPFAEYTRDQFWEFAAFFAEVDPRNFRVGDPMPARSLKIPNTTRTVSAKFFDGNEPKFSLGTSPRNLLADWLTTPENPWFARTAVNRWWAHFFGYGLLDPLDEPGPDNPPSHPALLDELTKGFIESGFDQRFLIRAVTRTKAYQRSSRSNDPSASNPRTLGRMAVKALTADQLIDSLFVATNTLETTPIRQRRFAFNGGAVRQEITTKFATSERVTEAQTSILQALAMMNGRFIMEQTHSEKSSALAAIIDAPFLDTNAKIETLFMLTLSRKPTAGELVKFRSYAEHGGPSADRKQALADIMWALLNSSEFMLNH